MCACGNNKKRNTPKIVPSQQVQQPPKPPVNLVPSSNRRLNKIYR